MMARTYDAIVVGARCAGAPTAMLLARKGYDVLAVDRGHFPSDTVSTHLIHAPGVAALRRWGLLDRVTATGCPPITTYTFDFGPIRLTGNPAREEQGAIACCPRRTVLDSLLVDAAREAGAEIREGFTVERLLRTGDVVTGIRGTSAGAGAGAGTTETARARIVIGADGARSRIASAVAAHAYREQPTLAIAYYSYWSGLPVTDAELMVRPGNGFAAFPTNDDLTLLLAAWPHAEQQAVKRDIEGNYQRAIEAAFGDRVAGARREERIVGGGVPNRFRVPYGAGWALVGDAGYVRDPVTAQGITDAFLDAELCAAAIDEAFGGDRSLADTMAAYHEQRDARTSGMYELTTQLAALQPPPPELQQLLANIAGHPVAMDEFAGVIAGTVAPDAFFAPSHVHELVGEPSRG